MPEAEFVFKIVEEGGAGGAAAAAGKGGDPMASPQPSARTQVREESQAQAGGAAEIVQEAQRKTRDEERKRPKPKPPEPKPDAFSIGEQAQLFGQAVAQRFGFGGVAAAIGTAALPVALGTAAVAAGVGVARLQARAAQRLRPFSADLAASGARETARQTLENLAQARMFGEELAESERQRGRFGAATSRLGTSIAAGPIGQDVGDIIELSARLTEGINAISSSIQTALGFTGAGGITGGLSRINELLTQAGIGRDPLGGVQTGLEIFRDFPHAEVNVVPEGMRQPRFDGRNNAAQFTTDQDRILDQF